MKTMFTSLALIAGGLLLAGWSVAAETTADPNCTAAPACGTCCPQCGCHEGLVPVCHPYCTTKKTVKYKYCCKCDTVCIPGLYPKCGCGCGCGEGGCASGCGCNEGGCGEGKHCGCEIYEVHKLTKIPYVVEEPVRKCTVTWVCPKCGCDCNCPCASGAAAPAAPGSMPPAPPAPPAGKAAAIPTGPDAAGYYSASDR